MNILIIQNHITIKPINKNNMTAVDLIFENFNSRSDSDFKIWMLHTYDYLKKMEKSQLLNFFTYAYIVEKGDLDSEKVLEAFKNYYDRQYDDI